jgi:hypothetical protein
MTVGFLDDMPKTHDHRKKHGNRGYQKRTRVTGIAMNAKLRS